MHIYLYVNLKKNKNHLLFLQVRIFVQAQFFFVQVEWLVVKAGLTNFLTTEKQKYCCNMYHERAFN